MNLPNRKPTRLAKYNYNQNGYFFITICTHNKECILSKIVGGGAFDAPKSILTKTGEIVNKYILSTNNISNLSVDKYVIMPNHIHLILTLKNQNGTSKAPSPTNTVISHSIATLKRFVNGEIGHNIFQRSFYDHIIRGEKDYLKIWEYIDNNPAKWMEDCYYNK